MSRKHNQIPPKPKQRKTCAMCGRTGKRLFARDPQGRTICRNREACVTRLCDNAFLDKPKVSEATWLSTALQDVHLYGVVSDGDTVTATLKLAPFIPSYSYHEFFGDTNDTVRQADSRTVHGGRVDGPDEGTEIVCAGEPSRPRQSS